MIRFPPILSVLTILAALLAGGVRPSAAANPPEAPSVPSGPAIVREVLPNGVTLIVRHNPVSNVVGMEIVSRQGTRSEASNQAGLANLTLRVMMGGAGPRTGEAIQDWFEDRGATADALAHPDYCELGAAIMAPEFPGMAEILANLVTHATLSPDRFHREQQAMLRQLQSGDRDEEAATYRSLRTLLADNTAYGRPEAGVVSSISTLALDDVTQFYHRMFAPGEMIVSVSGNVKTEDALRLLRGLFGNIPSHPAGTAPPPIHTIVQEPASMVLAGNGDWAWIMVGYLMPGVKDPDYAAVAVLNAILGGSNSGTLTSFFRDHEGIYDSGSFVQPFAIQSHIVGYVRAQPLLWNQKDQKSRSVVDDLQKQLVGVFAAIRDHGVTADQVNVARQFVLGQYLQTQERNRSAAAYLGWYESIGLGAGFNQQFVQDLRKVTPEQINKLAQAGFQASKEATVVMFPRPRVEEGS